MKAPLYRHLAGWLVIISCAAVLTVTAMAQPKHGIAMHGEPKYPPGFRHLDYANPDAPKGGELRLGSVGTFDTLHSHIIKGSPAAGRNLYTETLLQRVWDEPFTLYGRLAQSVEVPEDRSWVAFTLNPAARFSDGSRVTIDDVIFSLEMIRTHGRPNSRATYKKIIEIERPGNNTVKFLFADGSDRELPLLIGGFLPILSKTYWQGRDFTKTTLEPPLGSGPYVVEHIDPGRRIVYRRNLNYWGKEIPVNIGHYNFDLISYDYYRDSNIALEAFKAGDFDQRYEFDANRWATGYDFPAAQDGRVILEEFDHGIPSGLRAFAFNLRRPMFQDRRIRRALATVFDFEWINKTLLQGAYERTRSMFDNSNMAPVGEPTGAELALLDPWRQQLPSEVFGEPYQPPTTDASGNNRTNLRQAMVLLNEAGWQIREGKLVSAVGQPFEFEILLRSSSNEKLALAYKNSLSRLGIEVAVRLVDSSQYQARMEQYDFDMAYRRWGVSLSPGNEQQNYWSSIAAASPGSRNAVGVSNPAMDAIIDALVGAYSRTDLVDAARAIDRILMWEQYVVPLYHRSGFRVAYWNTLAHPKLNSTYGPVIETWWTNK